MIGAVHRIAKSRLRLRVAPQRAPLQDRRRGPGRRGGAITPAAMNALDAIRPAGVRGKLKLFWLSESQIARRVKVVAKAVGLADWELSSEHSGGGSMDCSHGPERRSHPTRSIAGADASRPAAWRAALPRRDCGIGAAVPAIGV